MNTDNDAITVLIEIILLLPPESIHICRQLSKEFNNKILELVWKTALVRKKFEKKLEHNWRTQNFKLKTKEFRK